MRKIGVAVAVAAAAVLFGAAACGGDKENTQTDDPMAAFRTCLEKQGVTMPERGAGRPSGAPSGAPTARPSGAPTTRPSGMPTRSAAEEKAMQACASLAPQGGGGPGRGGGPPQNGG